MIIAKDTITKESISYHFITSETNEEYRILKRNIESQEFTIRSISIDGRRGLFRIFEGIPIQMCHFHQQAILTRYLTKKAKLQESIELKRVASYLGQVSQCRFEFMLLSWKKRHQIFFNEKTYNEKTAK